MFERFTQASRDAVIAAQRFASQTLAREVREEHLMLGLLDGDDAASACVLDEIGVTAQARAALVDELLNLSRRAGIGSADAEALRDIGIDVDEVLGRMEELTDPPDPGISTARRGPFGRRKTRKEPGRRHVPFSTGAKRTLERTLREALDLRDNHIDSEHMLLALLARGGVVAEALGEHGVTYVDVRRAVTARNASG